MARTDRRCSKRRASQRQETVSASVGLFCLSRYCVTAPMLEPLAALCDRHPRFLKPCVYQPMSYVRYVLRPRTVTLGVVGVVLTRMPSIACMRACCRATAKYDDQVGEVVVTLLPRQTEQSERGVVARETETTYVSYSIGLDSCDWRKGGKKRSEPAVSRDSGFRGKQRKERV